MTKIKILASAILLTVAALSLTGCGQTPQQKYDACVDRETTLHLTHIHEICALEATEDNQ